MTLASRDPLDLDMFPRSLGKILRKPFELASADWDDLLEGIDVVHHYAWSSTPASANANPAGDLLLNVTATIGLLEALRRRRSGRLLFASSGGTVYGKVSSRAIEESSPLEPITAYGAGKVTAETYVKLFRSMHNVDCRIARIANPFGAGQNVERGVGAITTFLSRALSGQEITIWGDGGVVRDFIHVADAAAALVAMACAPRSDDFVFNVGTGSGTSLNEVLSTLEQLMGRALTVKRVPSRSIDVPVNVLSIERIRRSYGWSPRLSFSDGIRATIDDIRSGRSISTWM